MEDAHYLFYVYTQNVINILMSASVLGYMPKHQVYFFFPPFETFGSVQQQSHLLVLSIFSLHVDASLHSWVTDLSLIPCVGKLNAKIGVQLNIRNCFLFVGCSLWQQYSFSCGFCSKTHDQWQTVIYGSEDTMLRKVQSPHIAFRLNYVKPQHRNV